MKFKALHWNNRITFTGHLKWCVKFRAVKFLFTEFEKNFLKDSLTVSNSALFTLTCLLRCFSCGAVDCLVICFLAFFCFCVLKPQVETLSWLLPLALDGVPPFEQSFPLLLSVNNMCGLCQAPTVLSHIVVAAMLTVLNLLTHLTWKPVHLLPPETPRTTHQPHVICQRK